ncbi:V-type ATP synthase subunit F [Streptomyces sp. NPDC096152]|uniref:V-type ATP synthase subunit F n=1 Tax=Streptomyces sp. NPDC096152 TaxID=3366078 RepID=UPI00381FFA29
MSTVAAIGERDRVCGLALAGVAVHAAEGPEAAREAWQGLSPEVALVVLTPRAAEALGARIDTQTPLTVVLPV